MESTRRYCTLSDKNYLKFGKALIDSLISHSTEDFVLYYLCLDEETFESLTDYNSKVVPVRLSDVENSNQDLVNFKNRKPYNQFCWSLASCFSYYLLKEKQLDDILYIDSDIYFYQDPKLIFDEVGEKSVGIIRHRHNTNLSVDGEYNVGTVYFRNSDLGIKTLKNWMECVILETRPDLATCGDQKYLELFELICGGPFNELCVIDKTIAHGAPWNFRLYVYDYYNQDGTVVWGDRKQPLVFNHFSRVGFDSETGVINPTNDNYADHTLNFQVFNIPEVRNFYIDYANKLKEFS